MRRRRTTGRTILVVEERPYLWAALRQRVEPATAYVLSASPEDVAQVWATCEPWPWILVGATAQVPEGLAARLRQGPIPVHWLGEEPAGLRPGCVVHADWLTLAGALERLAGRELNGVRLMRNRGLRTREGQVVVRVPCLEGLFAAPDGLAGVDEARVAAELASSGLPLTVRREGDFLRLDGTPP